MLLSVQQYIQTYGQQLQIYHPYLVEVINNIVRMNDTSLGDKSYAKNSIVQRTVISKVRTMVERAIKRMHLNRSFPQQCFAMADLGCASGVNTLLSVSHVIDAVMASCRSPPELQIFLNDLPTNDFNSVFMSLPGFYSTRLLEEKRRASPSCYVSGTPGSFHGRLFPTSSLHFVHSSYSVHWLSQVPRGIENNKGHIYLAATSPPNVLEAYLNQFQSDFTTFLSNRAKEMRTGGGMVLTLVGRSSEDPTTNDSCLFWELLSKSLLDMAAEGIIEECDVDSFNIPNYYPSKGEVMDIVKREGSFNIDEMESFQVNWDVNDNETYEFDKRRSGESMANCIRAVAESMLSGQFGQCVIEDLFGRYAKYVGDHLSVERTKFFNIAISMSKK